MRPSALLLAVTLVSRADACAEYCQDSCEELNGAEIMRECFGCPASFLCGFSRANAKGCRNASFSEDDILFSGFIGLKHRSHILRILAQRGDEMDRKTNVKATMTKYRTHHHNNLYWLLSAVTDALVERRGEWAMDLVVESAWINSFAAREEALPHCHCDRENLCFSFVYYASVGDGAAPTTFWLNNGSQFHVPPREGWLLIFYGQLLHSVPPTETPRVTVSGNLYWPATVEKLDAQERDRGDASGRRSNRRAPPPWPFDML